MYIYILYLAVVRQSVMIQILLLIATSNKFLRGIPEKSSTNANCIYILPLNF